MNVQNPTNLRLGMRAKFLERDYELVGRVVMGVRTGDGWYTWNEFNLARPDGTEATLVYEVDEYEHWRIFTQFDPEYPMPASVAAKMRVGNALNLTNTEVQVTLVDQSTVKFVEGQAPQGVKPGSVAHYFNAEGGGLMQVVSWTNEEVEYFNGCNLSASEVADAFNIPASELVIAPHYQSDEWNKDISEDSNQYLSVKNFLTILAVISAVIVLIIIIEGRSSGIESLPVYKELAEDQNLFLNYNGILKNQHYKVASHDLVEIAEPEQDFERHEYELAADDGQTLLLACGETPKASDWILYKPLQPSQPLTPFQAGALRVGQTVNFDGLEGKITQLHLTRFEKVEQVNNSTILPGDVYYGFSAKSGSQQILVRWNTNEISFFIGTAMSKSEIKKAFSVY